ncbi:MAG: TonB-dependent receptor, partial [Rudaea sp.]
NWKIAIEYKPIEDLLIRATVSKVFRAPSVTDLFAGPGADSVTATDPCGAAALASNPACKGYTFQNTGTSQLNGIVTGQQYANAVLGQDIHLTPEQGKSYDYGFVYDPNWLPGLSVSADYYRIVLNNLIISGAGIAQTILNQCLNGDTQLCSLILRNGTGSSLGQIRYIFESPFNSGTLTTQGADFAAHYRLPETPVGNFRLGFAATYIQRYDVQQGSQTQGVAGHFDRTFGALQRWRGTGSVDWNWGSFNANWTARYIGHTTIGYPNANLGPSGNADNGNGLDLYMNQPFHYGSFIYHNVSFGYNIEPLNTMIQVGVDNVGDKQPPIFYQENVANANTDVNTFDPIGRFFFAKVTVKF